MTVPEFPGLEPDLERQLEASLELVAFSARHEPVVAEGWAVDGLGSAEWAAERIGKAQALIGLLDEQLDEWSTRLDEWHGRAVAPLRNTVEVLTRHLQDYALAVREETGVKTLSLPSGKVSTRLTSEKVVVEDAEAFITWARDYAPEALRVETKVDAPGLKAGPWAPWWPDGPEGVCRVIDKTTGEVVPGLAWREGHVSASVEVKP